MRVLVCGSRSWRLPNVIEKRLRELPANAEILHGGARGADTLAAAIALDLGFFVEEYAADWKRYGKRAGMIRNVEMLDSWPDLVLAFWDGSSMGTAHVIREARRRGIATEVIVERDSLSLVT